MANNRATKSGFAAEAQRKVSNHQLSLFWYTHFIIITVGSALALVGGTYLCTNYYNISLRFTYAPSAEEPTTCTVHEINSVSTVHGAFNHDIE